MKTPIKMNRGMTDRPSCRLSPTICWASSREGGVPIPSARVRKAHDTDNQGREPEREAHERHR